MKKNSIWRFIWRYRLLIIADIAVTWLSTLNGPFAVFGTLIYGPTLFFNAIMCALLARHWFFRQTLDEDAHSGFFVDVWTKNLTGRERVLLNLGMMSVLFIGAVLIFAALIK